MLYGSGAYLTQRKSQMWNGEPTMAPSSNSGQPVYFRWDSERGSGVRQRRNKSCMNTEAPHVTVSCEMGISESLLPSIHSASQVESVRSVSAGVVVQESVTKPAYLQSTWGPQKSVGLIFAAPSFQK